MLYKKRVSRAGLGYFLLALLFFLTILPFVNALTYQTGNDVYGILVDSGNTNVTGALNLTLQVGTCSLSSCSDINWSNSYTNATYTSLASLTNSTYFQYKATFFTENQNYTPWLFNLSLDYTYIDTTYPLWSFVSPTPSNNSGVSSSFIVNVSITEENLANVSYNWNGTLLNFNSTNESLTNLGSGSWVFAYTQTGLVVGSSYTYNVTIIDFAGNSNNTETRTINGNSNPSFSSILQSLNLTTDTDPGVNITITVNVSDTDTNFDSAILEWKNSTGNYGENNISMQNTTIKSAYTILNATLPLPSYESNITYRILANDTAGGSSYSSNYTIQSFWDCTWNATTDLGATAGWDENKQIGNISINNTGDSQYATTSCSLDFRLSYDLTEGRIYFDEDYIKPSDTYTVTAKTNLTIAVNASFLAEIKEESAIISISEFRSRSSTAQLNTTLSLVSSQSGPYLYNKIDSSPTSVYLTAGNFSLSGYARNLLGSATINENNTAYNVSFYWTLPSGITNVSGNVETNFTNITDNELHYSRLNASFSSLASNSPGVKNISLSLYGYNLTGSLIKDASNQTLLTKNVEVNFICYNVSDGVYVTSCGSLDGDYTAPASSSDSSTSSSSGGGGGGGGSASTSISSKADYHLIRGKQNEIVVPFVNTEANLSLKNLKFSVSGKLANFIEVIPSQYELLLAKEKIDIKLKITSPSFYELGRQEIVLNIRGDKEGSPNGYSENRRITVQINEISQEDATGLINNMSYELDVLNKTGIKLNRFLKLFSDAEKAYDEEKFEELIALNKDFKLLSSNALQVHKTANELSELIKLADEKGIYVSDSLRLLKLSQLSMEREDFEQAYERMKEAQLTYALEVKGEYGQVGYYLKNYPAEISLSALLFLVFSFSTYKIGKLKSVNTKIKRLKEEEEVLLQLMKLVQKYTFEDNKMGVEEYQQSMLEYEKKLANVIENLIELESIKAHALKFTSIEKRLKSERERLIELIKDIQEQYLVKGKMETKMYELRLESYQRRIGNIDQKLATFEARKVLEGNNIFKKIGLFNGAMK